VTDGHLCRLDQITWCPVQFQALVPGTDVRVHVVGEQIDLDYTESIRRPLELLPGGFISRLDVPAGARWQSVFAPGH
jgi:hypothetical protein